jgi:hypothetical protein
VEVFLKHDSVGYTIFLSEEDGKKLKDAAKPKESAIAAVSSTTWSKERPWIVYRWQSGRARWEEFMAGVDGARYAAYDPEEFDSHRLLGFVADKEHAQVLNKEIGDIPGMLIVSYLPDGPEAGLSKFEYRHLVSRRVT